MKRKPCEQCGRYTMKRIDGLAVCRVCASADAHFAQRHERRNVPGCPICDDRRAEDVPEGETK